MEQKPEVSGTLFYYLKILCSRGSTFQGCTAFEGTEHFRLVDYSQYFISAIIYSHLKQLTRLLFCSLCFGT